MRRKTRIVVISPYDGSSGRAFRGDRGRVVRDSIGRMKGGCDHGYDHGFIIHLDRGFEMFIPEGCFRPLRTLELIAECADE